MSNFALPERLFPMYYNKICLISASYSSFSYPVNPAGSGIDSVKVLRSGLMKFTLLLIPSGAKRKRGNLISGTGESANYFDAAPKDVNSCSRFFTSRDKDSSIVFVVKGFSIKPLIPNSLAAETTPSLL